MKKRLKILLYIFAFLRFSAVPLFCLAGCLFTFALMPAILNGTPASPAVGNWYQQFMPSLGSRQINDITFIDSLTGYAVTTLPSLNDTAFILKTTNSGDNWFINHRDSGFVFNRIKFINNNSGFAIGTHLTKTINGGLSWNIVSSFLYYNDMAVLSNDTIFAVKSESLTGGVYRTTNGGASWDHQINLGSSNPEKIYMFNQMIGYISRNQGSSGYVRKTTDGGSSWNLIVSNDYFFDINFTDSLKGWKCSVFGMKLTTNGGANWINQTLPQGGIISVTGITSFHIINKDTIYGVGGYAIYPNSQVRGILYRTIDGGNTWLFQIPDTAIHIGGYSMITFTDKNNGWAYNIATGIHTTTGGDPVWLTGIEQISTEIPTEYKLYQNYPNPFNPATNIKYSVTSKVKRELSNVKLTVYDITGKEIIKLVDTQQSAGTYKVDWNAAGYSSGVYFYTLIVNGKIVDTKKMLLVK